MTIIDPSEGIEIDRGRYLSLISVFFFFNVSEKIFRTRRISSSDSRITRFNENIKKKNKKQPPTYKTLAGRFFVCAILLFLLIYSFILYPMLMYIFVLPY